MRYLAPALVFVALTGGVACAKRPLAPMAAPEPQPTAQDTSRQAALALLRAELEVQTARRRVRLPGDARIVLTAAGAGRFTFRTAYYAYVPASSLPWVYQAAGRIDLQARKVTLTALVAEAEAQPSASAAPLPAVAGPYPWPAAPGVTPAPTVTIAPASPPPATLGRLRGGTAGA